MRIKRWFNVIIVFSSLLCAHNRFDSVSLEVIFLPESQASIYKELESAIDTARSSVMVAMYWLTYDPFIHKLIELRKKNVDVQVVLDGSMFANFQNVSNIVTLLNKSDIYPLILPSKQINRGIMHNKFIVIDNKTVWTGSANFTKAALDSGNDYLNDENILIINIIISGI